MFFALYLVVGAMAGYFWWRYMCRRNVYLYGKSYKHAMLGFSIACLMIWPALYPLSILMQLDDEP